MDFVHKIVNISVFFIVISLFDKYSLVMYVVNSFVRSLLAEIK